MIKLPRDPLTGRFLKTGTSMMPGKMQRAFNETLGYLDSALTKWERVIMDG